MYCFHSLVKIIIENFKQKLLPKTFYKLRETSYKPSIRCSQIVSYHIGPAIKKIKIQLPQNSIPNKNSYYMRCINFYSSWTKKKKLPIFYKITNNIMGNQ